MIEKLVVVLWFHQATVRVAAWLDHKPKDASAA